MGTCPGVRKTGSVLWLGREMKNGKGVGVEDGMARGLLSWHDDSVEAEAILVVRSPPPSPRPQRFSLVTGAFFLSHGKRASNFENGHPFLMKVASPVLP